MMPQMLRRLLPCLLFLITASAAAAATPCMVSPGCTVDGGRYLAHAPSGWDGRAPLPAIVYHHGWQESAEDVVADKVLTAFANRHGLLLVAPHGEGKTWSYPGAPGRHRDEFAFAGALLKDVKARFPVDARRLVAVGFSQGGSMVWNLACHAPGLYSHHAAVAGGFWEPSPTACSGRGVNLIHIHGLADATVPMAGRALRDGRYRQSNLWRDWRIWLEEDQCPELATRMSVQAGRSCRIWNACGRPGALALCLHESGHQVHESDLEALWALVQATPANP